MLHKCENCQRIYLVSDYNFLCDHCGQERQRMIWQLSAPDDAVEWWRLSAQVSHGEQLQQERKWEIK